MEPRQPDDLPFTVSIGRDPRVTAKFAKQQARRFLNRGYSKHLRQRRKERVHFLESQEAELTEQVNRLREIVAKASSAGPDDGLHETLNRFLQNLAITLSDPQATDLELNAKIDELEGNIGVLGKARISKLANTFQQTMNMMFPMHVKFSLWISGSETSESHSEFPKWEDFLESINLTNEQNAAFQEYQQTFEQDKTGLRESFDQFKQTSSELLCHAKVLHSLIQKLRLILTPRQAATWILWIPKYYSFLDAEKVLNYGNNSTDLLNPE